MRLLVFGDRKWLDFAMVFNEIAAIHAAHRIEVVIEGEAPGADIMARSVAESLHIPVLPFPAPWEVTEDTPVEVIRHRRDGTPYDVTAGPRRNTQMLEEGKPTHGLAFHLDLSRSRGTIDMLRKCERAHVPVTIRPKDTRPPKTEPMF